MKRKRIRKKMQHSKRNGKKAKANRNYKDTVFRKLFNDEQKMIELYNALEGTDYGPDTKIEITTLEDVLFIDRKNDLSFIIDDHFVIFGEHQSTVAPNISVRLAVYAGRVFENMIEDILLYGEKQITFPAPAFYLFYNGSRNWDVKTFTFSECYKETAPENSMELVVKVVNVSYNEHNEILKRSETLMGYSKLVAYIKEGMKSGMTKENAIDKAVKHCIKEGYLVEFLKKYGQEIGNMLFGEVTWDEVIGIREEDAYERGREQGREEGITALILDNLEEKKEAEVIVEKLMCRFSLSEEMARKHLEECILNN